MSLLLLSFLLTASVTFGNMQLLHRQECGEICAPNGATSQTLPEVGTPLIGLLDDLVATVNGGDASIENSGVPAAKRQESSFTFCCALQNDCYLLQNFNVPFCYDNWTTGFDFPDGSYGSLVSGNFSTSSGTKLNLVYGNYETPDGTTGNIYSAASTSQPNLSTMPMPTPWTSSGVGTAVPASELGSMTPVVTSASGITAITLPSLTISAGPSACTMCIGNHTTIPGFTGLLPPTTYLNATATATGNSSTSNASIIIPPITKSWAQSCGVAVRTYIFIFLTAMVLLATI